MPVPTKLQRAGRAYLLRLVAECGPAEAARILRALADELEGLTDTALLLALPSLRRQ